MPSSEYFYEPSHFRTPPISAEDALRTAEVALVNAPQSMLDRFTSPGRAKLWGAWVSLPYVTPKAPSLSPDHCSLSWTSQDHTHEQITPILGVLSNVVGTPENPTSSRVTATVESNYRITPGGKQSAGRTTSTVRVQHDVWHANASEHNKHTLRVLYSVNRSSGAPEEEVEWLSGFIRALLRSHGYMDRVDSCTIDNRVELISFDSQVRVQNHLRHDTDNILELRDNQLKGTVFDAFVPDIEEFPAIPTGVSIVVRVPHAEYQAVVEQLNPVSSCWHVILPYRCTGTPAHHLATWDRQSPIFLPICTWQSRGRVPNHRYHTTLVIAGAAGDIWLEVSTEIANTKRATRDIAKITVRDDFMPTWLAGKPAKSSQNRNPRKQRANV